MMIWQITHAYRRNNNFIDCSVQCWNVAYDSNNNRKTVRNCHTNYVRGNNSVTITINGSVITSAEGGYVLLRSVCLSVCLSVRQITEKSCERILTKFLGEVGHGSGTNEFNFGDDPDHRTDPGVRSTKSGFIGLSNYQRILMKFYGELGCDLETNWLQRSGKNLGIESECVITPEKTEISIMPIISLIQIIAGQREIRHLVAIKEFWH